MSEIHIMKFFPLHFVFHMFSQHLKDGWKSQSQTNLALSVIQTTLLTSTPIVIIEIYPRFHHWSKSLNQMNRLLQQAKAKSMNLQQQQLQNWISKQNQNNASNRLMYVIKTMWNCITFGVKHAWLFQISLKCTPTITNHLQSQLLKGFAFEKHMLPVILSQNVT